MSEIKCKYYPRKCLLYSNPKYEHIRNMCPRDEKKCEFASDLEVEILLARRDKRRRINKTISKFMALG